MSEQTVQQITRESPRIEALKVQLMEQAQGLALSPQLQQALQRPEAQYRIAGFDPAQETALRAAESQGIGAFSPFINSASRAMEGAYGLTGEAADVLRGADVRNQFTDAQRAIQQAGQATAGITSGLPAVQQGYGALGIGTLAGIGGLGQYDPRSAAAFMNPYQQAVTQQALQEMRRQGDIARQGQAAQAVRSGAFGGTREGVQRAEMERGLQDVMSQRIFQDYAQNYGQAQAAAMQAEEQARQRQVGVGQLMGQMGSQYGNLAAQQGALYGQQAQQLQNLGLGIGSLAGQQFGIGQQMAAGLGGLGQQLGSIGIQSGALGQTAQGMSQADINFLYNIGQSRQALAQQTLDAQRASAMQQIYSPFQSAAFLSDIYRGAPSTQMATTAASTPQPSPFQQVTGTVLGAAAASKALGKLF